MTQFHHACGTERDWHRSRRRGGNACTAVAFVLAAILSGCASGFPDEKASFNLPRAQPDACVGWQIVPLKFRTAQILQQNDPEALANIEAHNLRGKNMGCWE